MKKIIIPPIKSQGIKTKLIPTIMSIIPHSDNGKWIEPFMGTGVVCFNARYKSAIVNDINPHIVRFYSELADSKINAYIVSKYLEEQDYNLKSSNDNGDSYFKTVRKRFNASPNSLDFLFLSRAGFNGMMRFNKKGHFNIPFCKKKERFSKSYITKISNQVKNVSEIINPRWQFLNLDFVEIINMASENDIIYCDPPYFGRSVDYYNGWDENNERKLHELLSNTPSKFILSTWHHTNYRENIMFKQLWSKFNYITIDHFYHNGANIENRNSVVEALVTNFDFPECVNKHNSKRINADQQLSIF